ncbi:hypothetical protein [Nostoc sp. PA-18-2419]|nr:hypothetical protein [Nostoc sp. PA-18-2419]
MSTMVTELVVRAASGREVRAIPTLGVTSVKEWLLPRLQYPNETW